MPRIIVLIVMLVLVAPLAIAQVPGMPFSIYAGGGLDFPSQPDSFKEDFKTGYHGFAAVGFDWFLAVQLVGKIELHKLPGKGDALRFSDPFGVPVTVDAPDLQIWLFGGDLRASIGVPGASTKPFALGGIGVARLAHGDINSINDITVPVPWEDETKFYWNIGGGVEFGGPVKMFAQIRYVSILTGDDNTSLIPISVGLRFF